MSDLPPDDNDPTVVTTCGIVLRDVIGAIGRAELLGVPVTDADRDMLNS